MIRKIIQRVNEWWEEGLRGLLGRLTPDGRVILIVILFLFFSGLSIYMTVSGIYNFGKKEGQKLQIEQIGKSSARCPRTPKQSCPLKLF